MKTPERINATLTPDMNLGPDMTMTMPAIVDNFWWHSLTPFVHDFVSTHSLTTKFLPMGRNRDRGVLQALGPGLLEI